MARGGTSSRTGAYIGGMATLTDARATSRAMPAFGVRFDWLVILACAWMGFGLYWDGWAHGYGLPDSFWTIWHAAFYSGFAASAVGGGAPGGVGGGRAGAG